MSGVLEPAAFPVDLTEQLAQRGGDGPAAPAGIEPGQRGRGQTRGPAPGQGPQDVLQRLRWQERPSAGATPTGQGVEQDFTVTGVNAAGRVRARTSPSVRVARSVGTSRAAACAVTYSCQARLAACLVRRAWCSSQYASSRALSCTVRSNKVLLSVG